ncbi:MAG TPA: GNAT family N-acetyltransferase [Jatrophihabitantaceae bacterium]|jgi:acyl-CoA synthetase (NDP forming)/GNAT superfamily N-acetyltransferase
MTTGEADAVRADGGLVHIRPISSDDRAALLELDERVSERSIYLRFFTVSRHAADVYVPSLVRPPDADHQALVALVGGQIVGVASFERVTATSAEIAVLIDDHVQHEGIGTLLIEHLASCARRYGIKRFIADVLSENATMINVIRRLGFNLAIKSDYSTFHITIDLEPSAAVIAAVDDRERTADVASMQAVLAPRSVAVVGASVRPRAVGHEVLRNILDSGYTGTVYAVNPKHDSVLGVASVASPADLPEPPDLAVVAVPASQVLDVLRACGERGTRAVILLSAGFGETGAAGRAHQRDVLDVARRYGMRLVGPNCLGVLNTDPAVRLNATFAPVPMDPGQLGLVSQSGALGIAVLIAAQQRGLGVSQFVSVGNKADVSGNDLLLAWERDPRTSVIALYLESFGNPRKFARIARRVSRSKPIIAIKAGRSAAGQRAGASHTAAAASSDSVVDALFEQAGVLRVDTMEQMLDAARVLCEQPLPAGPRVAIVGNSGGPGILAADAAQAAGLTVVDLQECTAGRIRAAVPSAASCRNPIDLGAGVQPAEVAGAVTAALDADEVDLVLTVFTDTLVADPVEVMQAIALAAATSAKPLIATHVGGPAGSVSPPAGRKTPVFSFPEPAAAAAGLTVRYTRIRSAQTTEPEPLETIDQAGARALIEQRLAAGDEWLSTADIARLLVRYGIPLCAERVVADADAAVAAARELGYPVAAKVASGVIHKTDIGGVHLNIADESALRTAVAELQAAASGDVLIQPMVGPGIELIMGAVQDAQFGPAVMVGAGGVLADMIADRQLRLAPLSEEDAEQMVSGLRTAALLDGFRGRPVVSRPAVQRLLLRIASLIEDLPEIAELDLNPVVCRGRDDLIVVDAKVRIAPAAEAPDPMLRQLRRG